MSNESTLIEALSNLVVTADPTNEYRLHYNDLGDIIMCSMQNHPDSLQYLVVTKEQYEQYFRFRVLNKKLNLISQGNGVRVPFIKAHTGFRVVKNNAALLLESHEEYEHIEYYDTRNN